MSDAEKVGQLVGTWGGLLRFENDVSDLKRSIRDHHVGIVAPFGWGGSLSTDPGEIIETVNELQRFALEETRLGIPLLLNVDAVHGNAYVAGATVFPHGLGMAATWNPDAVETAASSTATEVRQMGAHQNYAPTCDVGRDPRWGRFFETFGESPRLCASMAAAKVRGYQGDGIHHEDSVIATAKHFPAYSEPERGEDASPVDVSEYKLRNVFTPPFEAALDAGVTSVMPSYNSINGEPCHGSRSYLTDLLRDDLGFDGHIVSDWNGVTHLCDDHRTATDRRDAIRQSRSAGLDVASVGHVGHTEGLLALVEDEAGGIDPDRLDRSVRRILRLKFEMSLFENPLVDEREARETLGNPEHRRVARTCARDSMTLLKNDGILPLRGDEDVFVGGPNADDLVHQLGGWSVHQSVNVPGDTVFEAIEKRTSGDVFYEQGTTLNQERDLAACVEHAATADVAVLALGEGWYLHEFGPAAQAGTETGDWPTRSDLSLSEPQQELVRRVHETGTPVVGVLITGRPLIVEWMDRNVPAILMAYFPGTEGGTAIAETLFGDNDPSGRLPMSVPKSMGDLPQHFNSLKHPRPIGDDQHPDSYDPLYAFGHGLSYTSFDYSDLRAAPSQQSDGVDVSVTVSNTGDRSVVETVQVFARQETSSRVRPRRFLVGFDRTALAAGETTEVSLSIPAEHLGFYDPSNGYIIENGTYHISVDELETPFELGAAPK